MEPEVRYCTTADGVRIAYTVTSDGPPIVSCMEPIVSHVQLEWSHSVASRLLAELARHNTLIRFDFRGSGLCAPGEVLVSETVRSLARTSSGVRFEDRSERDIKGVGEPVRVWSVLA